MVPREVETLAKVCTAKKQLSVAQNKSYVTPLGVVVVVVVFLVIVVTGASVGIEDQSTTFRGRFSPSAECFSDQTLICTARILPTEHLGRPRPLVALLIMGRGA